jgi:hypothetical protein
MPVSVDEVRAVASSLERAYEVVVRGRLKFRVGSIVFLAFAKDGETMGLGFPKDWRAAAIESNPETFSLPRESDLRFNWIVVRLAALDHEQMVDLVEDAWALCVPKFLVEARRARRDDAPRSGALGARLYSPIAPGSTNVIV